MIGVTVLGSGSTGNAVVIQGEDKALLIDAGFSMKQTRQRLAKSGIEPSSLEAILVSHEHGDHVKGLRVAAKQLEIPVYCNRSTAMFLKDGKYDPGKMTLFNTGTDFTHGEFRIFPFSVPHDAMDPVGFIVKTKNHKIGVATDLGHVSNPVAYHLQECDILVIESNHDLELLKQSQRPWALKQRIMGRHGHLSNDASSVLTSQIIHERTQHIVLAHASEDCNRPHLIEQSLTDTLSAASRPDLTPLVARQNEALPPLWVD